MRRRYYFTERPDNDTYIKAFPKGFRMIAGNSNKRTFYGPIPDPPMSEWQDSDLTQQSLMEKATGFNCLHYAYSPNEGSLEYHYLRNKTFLDSNCTDGVRAELMFPSCWNGVDLDSANHSTHVAYPSEIKYGQCPDGYPVKLPILFYEIIYTTDMFNGTDGQFVFANGDPIGYGYHGDFLCAWEDGVLQSAIDNPTCTPPPQEAAGSGRQEDCPVFRLQDKSTGMQCKMEVPESLLQEQINFVQELPGNVPIQSGPESASMPGATQSSSAVPLGTANSTISASPPDPTPGPTASTSGTEQNATTTEPPSDSNQVTTLTSTFMSNNTEVHLVLVEAVVTVTVSDAADSTGEVHKRHMHKHAHKDRRIRF